MTYYQGNAESFKGLKKKCPVCGERCNSNRAKFCSPRCYLMAHGVQQPNGCIHWSGPVGNHGYGFFNYAKVTHTAHRAAYIAFVGSIPDGMYVCHKCDVKICVNPDHLFVGTHDDNVMDMVKKRRNYRKLTDDEVRQIRSIRGPNYAQLARCYGVTDAMIRHIILRHWWKDVF